MCFRIWIWVSIFIYCSTSSRWCASCSTQWFFLQTPTLALYSSHFVVEGIFCKFWYQNTDFWKIFLLNRFFCKLCYQKTLFATFRNKTQRCKLTYVSIEGSSQIEMITFKLYDSVTSTISEDWKKLTWILGPPSPFMLCMSASYIKYLAWKWHILHITAVKALVYIAYILRPDSWLRENAECTSGRHFHFLCLCPKVAVSINCIIM